MEVSKGLTVWETVTQHNFENMKNDYSQEHGNFTALMYIRSGVKTDLTQCEVYNVEIGDEIARPIKDGDLVFCNRPPSVHKHSLIGLKVRILDIPSFAINPLICPPMGADFDGDCLAVFVPQSMGSRAEIDLAMAENQFLTSHGGACTFGLTQDSLLAAHKLTSSPILIKRETMEQGCLWSDACMPRPAIVKSPKGAFFTSCQLYQLPLPRDFDYSEPGILVSGGEILESRGKAGWAGNSNGLLRSIVEKYGCHLALNYLSSCQMMLTLWLSQVGFSAGLRDVYETQKSKTREGMKNEIMQAFDEFEYRINTKIRSLDYLCSKQDEYSGSFVRDCGVESHSSFEGLRLQYMQELISRIQDVTLKYVPEENSMMKMVTSGSKGSVKKFVEQFGCLGFQTLRGKHSVTLEKDKFVRNSFIEGLTPHEFMMQTISFRDTAIYQALRVSEPGVLFKNLMLFGRDVHVYYDGTVRNHHDNHVIQFLYGGLRGHKEENSEERETKKLQRDPKDLAGEPVGILAAMAIAQPAYEALLESAKVSANSSHSCPLKHLQVVLSNPDSKLSFFVILDCLNQP
jgi:DNA-directed RNA polymerase beta' subunit